MRALRENNREQTVSQLKVQDEEVSDMNISYSSDEDLHNMIEASHAQGTVDL